MRWEEGYEWRVGMVLEGREHELFQDTIPELA
jgi:hypothetical protein